MLLEVGLGQFRQESTPCRLEVGARLVEVGGRAVLALTPVRHRIEAAVPLPLIDMDGHAGADADRADMDVEIEDAPALLGGIWIAAAGEGGHGPHHPADQAGGEAARAWGVSRRTSEDLDP
jgi:hypothetical protein